MNGMYQPSADLFAELNRMQSVLDQVFRPTSQSSIRSSSNVGFPHLNVGHTPTTIEVMALAPGLDLSALELTVDRGLLILSGERPSPLPSEGERTNVYARERYAGRFHRVVSLPEDADLTNIQASYKDGVLRVTVAKQASSQPRRIDVQ